MAVDVRWKSGELNHMTCKSVNTYTHALTFSFGGRGQAHNETKHISIISGSKSVINLSLIVNTPNMINYKRPCLNLRHTGGPENINQIRQEVQCWFFKKFYRSHGLKNYFVLDRNITSWKKKKKQKKAPVVSVKISFQCAWIHTAYNFFFL